MNRKIFMKSETKNEDSPIVLFLGGHDPTGGAGIQADIETASKIGCRAISLITCLTAQNSYDVDFIQPQTKDNFERQADLLLSDISPTAVKIGLIGDLSIASAVVSIVKKLDIPVVTDPILKAGGGKNLSNEPLLEFIREELLPISDLIIPNKNEAFLLAKVEAISDAISYFNRLGCPAGLISGVLNLEKNILINHFFMREHNRQYEWPLLPETYHGSGCTLSSACACELALGVSLSQAVENAQEFTWKVLKNSEKPGLGQWFPNRR